MPKTVNEFAAELESVEEGSAKEFFDEYMRQHRATFAIAKYRQSLTSDIVDRCLSWLRPRRGPDYWTLVCQKLIAKEIREGRRTP